VHVTRNPNHYALARKLIATEPADYSDRDDGGSRSATRTDIVAKPAKHFAGLPPTPDSDDPTMRMSPDRVMALLKGEDVPEPFESTTPGQNVTRILDPEELRNAQAPTESSPVNRAPQQPTESSPVGKAPPRPAQSSPVAKSPARPAQSSPVAKTPSRPTESSSFAKEPFEIVENLPARPPRLPSEFATIPAIAASDPPRHSAPPLKTRIARTASLCLMALLVFSSAFVFTRTMRDERSRTLSREVVIRWYDGAAARVRGWFEPEPAAPLVQLKPAARPTASSKPPAPASAQPSATVASPAAPSESSTPVVRLEDLTPLVECTTPDCAPSSLPTDGAKKQPPQPRGRAPR